MSSISETCNLIEDVATEFLERRQQGDSPSIEDYAARYPELSDEIHDLFPVIEALDEVHRNARQSAARDATAKPLRLTELGDFKILREIGRGGMGVVYEAEQRSLGRRVALKVLPKQSLLDPDQLKRFQREARISAQLHHTNIVSLFGIGEQDGFHFLVMEVIDGLSLQEVIARLQRDRRHIHEDDLKSENDTTAFSNLREAYLLRKSEYWQEVARIGYDVADALQHAVDQGVLHRDVKPGNLLFDRHGKVWVTDFGLAQALNADETKASQSIAGTLNYISPEGFLGNYGPQGDIYSLGLSRYELLTLEPAYKETLASKVCERIAKRSFPPPRPREIDPTIPRDLEAIVLKAISHVQDARYRSALDLANDLKHYRRNYPISARRSSLLQQSWLWCRRNKTHTALGGVIGMLLLLVSTVMACTYLQARQSNQEIRLALDQATSERQRSRATLNVAVSALDNIYQSLSPDQLNSTGESPQAGSFESNITTTVVAQPVLSDDTAKVLEGLLPFYGRLAEESGDRQSIDERVVMALGRLGDVHRVLGQYQQAHERYHLALDTLGRLREENPNSSVWNIETARIENRLGLLSYEGKDFLQARQRHRNALEVLSSAEVSGHDEHVYERSRALYFLGRRTPRSASKIAIDQIGQARRMPQGDIENARNSLRNEEVRRKRHWLLTAINQLTSLERVEPRHPEYDLLLACCYREVARLTEEPNERAVYVSQSRNLLRHLVNQYPDNQYFRFELIDLLRCDFPGKHRKSTGSGRLPDRLREAAKHCDRLAADHPYVLNYQVERMHVYHKLGHVLTHKAKESKDAERDVQLEEAREALNKARCQAQLLVERWPEIRSHHLWPIIVDGSLVRVLLQQEKRKESIQLVEPAIQALDSLSRDQSLSQEFYSNVLTVWNVFSDLASLAEIPACISDRGNTNS